MVCYSYENVIPATLCWFIGAREDKLARLSCFERERSNSQLYFL